MGSIECNPGVIRPGAAWRAHKSLGRDWCGLDTDVIILRLPNCATEWAGFGRLAGMSLGRLWAAGHFSGAHLSRWVGWVGSSRSPRRVVTRGRLEYNRSMSTDAILKELVAWAQTRKEIVALYLYGSHAEGSATGLSDLDVAVAAQADFSRSELWRLEERAAARWPETVDICVLNLAPLAFRYQVISRGRRLWTADADAVAGLESLIWRQYWDLRPHLEHDWKGYVRHVMEQKSEVERQQYQTALAEVRAVHLRVRETAVDYTGGLQE